MISSRNVNKPIAFNISDRDLPGMIEQYKADLKAGKFPRASWPHFCSYLGFTENEVGECIQRGQEEACAYTRRSVLLKRQLTWIRGQLLSGDGWGGQNQSKAIFALKQDNGDHVSYSDTPANSGPTEVRVTFGGSDARGKRAAK